MSSLEIVAAPCRANAFSASVLPAPMPPVIATATGRTKLLLVGFGRRRGSLALGVAGARLVRGLGVRLDALVDELRLEVAGVRRRGRRSLATRRLDNVCRNGLWCGLLVFGNGLAGSFCRRQLRCGLFVYSGSLGRLCFACVARRLRLRKDLLGKVEVRRPLDRLRVVGTRHDAAALDPLQR